MKATKLINLTNHDINEVYTGTRIPTSLNQARVNTYKEQVDTIHGMPVFDIKSNGVIGVPEPVEGTIYIVSALVLRHAKGRTDLICPGNPVRNEKGNVIGCQGFKREID